MNLNQLAKRISDLEGGKQNLSIAQIKEVVRCMSFIMRYELDIVDVIELIDKLGVAHTKQKKSR